MSENTPATNPIVEVAVEPGICGFPCSIKVQKTGKRMVSVEVIGSECKQIQRLATQLTEMSMPELFKPITRNPVYTTAEKSGCHPSCAIPTAILKAVEVSFGMALPKEVQIEFNIIE